jgi:nucleoside-diphosphate-sugar epimerase
MSTRILFTGGTGKAGRHVLPWLLNEGYQVLNFDGSGSRLGDERANRVDFGYVFLPRVARGLDFTVGENRR